MLGETLTVIILAGGKSQRMGTDKAKLLWEGKPLLVHLVDRFQTVGMKVVIAGGPSEWAERLKGLSVPIVSDLPEHSGFGPLAGLEAGLQAVKDEIVGLVACDLPFASPPMLRLLTRMLHQSKTQAAVPVVGGMPQPLHAVYARTCLPSLVSSLEHPDKSMRSFLRRLPVTWVDEATLRSVADPVLACLNLNRLPNGQQRNF